MRFPQGYVATIADYADQYFADLNRAAAGIDRSKLKQAAELIETAIRAGKTIYTCGNGGSAAIANHLLCDFAKGIQTDTTLKPKVVSLSSHLELMLAIGNDIGFAEIFSYQAKSWAGKGDVLIAISSSGNSENVVRALDWAKANGIATIVLTGFDGGRAMGLADVGIHVPASNYGVAEDIHQSIMHILAQYLRQHNMDKTLIPLRKF